MLCKRIFSVAALISSTLAAPSPQEFDPNDQVEVVGPVSTNDPEYDYGDDYGGFFGGGFPSIFGAPRVRVLVVPVDEAGLDGGVGGIGDFLSSIFGPTRELAPPSESEQPSEDCGVMCTFIKELLEGHLKGVRDHIDDVRDRENEIGGDYDFGGDSDNGFDVNNSTHTTKVLEDGSVVHINKTTISDTDEDGNRCSVRFAWTRHNNIEKLKIGILKQDKLFSLVIVYYLFILSFPSHFISVSSSTNLSSTQSAIAKMGRMRLVLLNLRLVLPKLRTATAT